MTQAWTALSWLALTLGFAGTWLAPRRPVGWLICAASSTAWLAVNIAHDIPAAAAASLIAIGVSSRNWRVTARAAASSSARPGGSPLGAPSTTPAPLTPSVCTGLASPRYVSGGGFVGGSWPGSEAGF